MKNKSAKIASFLITLVLLLVFASTVGYSMISKSDKSITNSFNKHACDLKDYDGDGYSNFAEQTKSLAKDYHPCPCDDDAVASSWGYVPRNSTFNRTDKSGPYLIFNEKYKPDLVKRNWISQEDFEEMETQLEELRQLKPGKKLETSMVFSDTLEQYKRKGVDDKMISAKFFCPKSCANVKDDNDYTCCDLKTFQKEWFKVGYDDFGLVGKCKTDPTVCNDRIVKWCADRQEAKRKGQLS